MLAQMSLPSPNLLKHNTHFLLGLMNRHLVRLTWLKDLAVISLNCISNVSPQQQGSGVNEKADTIFL